MDSFPAHAIIPSEVKDDTSIRGGGHSENAIAMSRVTSQRQCLAASTSEVRWIGMNIIPCGARCSQLPKVL